MPEDGANAPEKNGTIGAVMVVGAGIAGMHASLELANAGYKVYLVEKLPAIGGNMARLDKTFPTNDCAMCTISPKLVECGKHENIEIITNTDVESVSGLPGDFRVRLRQQPRFVIEEKCTGCGDCTANCPVETLCENDECLSLRKAIYKRYPQAIPNAYAISKDGRPPCRLTCPAGVNCQGYIALTAAGKYAEAYELVRNRHPLPSVCGRICHHPCESKCNRTDIDEPVAINYIKRFVSDRARGMLASGEAVPAPRTIAEPNGHRVGIVGAGPAGLTAAGDLIDRGYSVTLYDAAEKPGGMLRAGIPLYRLERDVLDEEAAFILNRGVDYRGGTVIGRDKTLDDIKTDGCEAIFLATGAWKSRDLDIEGQEMDGIESALSFLGRVNAGRKVELKGRVLVVGGGNVAIDAGRTALRCGADEVTMVCLEGECELPAHPWEAQEALEEGIVFEYARGPKRFVGEDGRVVGLETVVCTSVFDSDGRFNPMFAACSEHLFSAEHIIVAIGQAADTTVLDGSGVEGLVARGRFIADPLTLQSAVPHIFVGGDALTGPASAVEAVAHGHEAAESIDRYLQGIDLRQGRERTVEEPAPTPDKKIEKAPRQSMPLADAAERRRDFRPIETGYTEEQALEEARRCLNCGLCSECLQCVAACQRGAIDHEMKEKLFDIEVGALILSPGSEHFDPALAREYGYERYPNVITSIEYERILSASGPYEGRIIRPSDGKEPHRIAWIQCVGSRDERCGNDYCSSVCCMYASKEALMSVDHLPGLEATIFYNDLRAYGKGYERYYAMAADAGVRYVKSIVSTIRQVPGKGDLRLRFSADDGALQEEEFDMVVLSVGLVSGKERRALLERLEVDADRYGFCVTDEFRPAETSRPGIFACGTMTGPMDIPESVMSAGGAVAAAEEALSDSRHSMIAHKDYPAERDIAEEEPRIGVFVCWCGSNIARVVDVKAVAEYTASLPGVVHAEDNIYTCSTDTQKRMIEMIREKGLNRVVVSSCTPRTHEPLFRETLREAGLNPYLFEMANIRDQCSWVHADDHEAATQKAMDLVRMAVGRAAKLEPLQDLAVDIDRHGLVIGGGLSGMTAALSLASQGFGVTLVENGEKLGGMAQQIGHTSFGKEVQPYLAEIVDKTLSSDRIQVLTSTEVLAGSGHVGSFHTKLKGPEGETEISHGITIVATGAVEHRPDKFLYGQDPRVLTQIDLERLMGQSALTETDEVLMIQCVGSREADHRYCSRVCCSEAVKNAIALKKERPERKVVICYRDVRTYGLHELQYKAARDSGVLFVRYAEDEPPSVVAEDGRLKVVVKDTVLGRDVSFTPDMLVLSSAVRPHPGNPDLSARLKLQLDADGFYMEAHMKLRPLDFAGEGVYLCGLAHGPKLIGESLQQAKGAAARASTILCKDKLYIGGEYSVVDEDKCAACLTCVRSCPYDVPTINSEGVAVIEPASCQGCGICAALCPGKAIELQHYRDRQIIAKMESL